MLDIGWTEIVMIAVAALVVLGPKELPRALKTFGAVMAKARGMAREFQSGVDEMIRETELDDLRKDLEKATRFDFDDDKGSKIDPTTGNRIGKDATSKPAIAPPEAAGKEVAGTASTSAPAPGAVADAVPPAAKSPASGSPPSSSPPAVSAPTIAGTETSPRAISAPVAANVGAGRTDVPPLSATGFDQDYAPRDAGQRQRQALAEDMAVGEFLPPEAEEPSRSGPAPARDQAATRAAE